MSNSEMIALRWTEFVANRPEFGAGEALLAQFQAGQITRLCDCGCNSYTFKLSPNAKVAALTPATDYLLFELEFSTHPTENLPVSIRVFSDRRGNLSGIDVDYCVNSYPVPQNLQLIEPPFQVRGVLANAI